MPAKGGGLNSGSIEHHFARDLVREREGSRQQVSKRLVGVRYFAE